MRRRHTSHAWLPAVASVLLVLGTPALRGGGTGGVPAHAGGGARARTIRLHLSSAPFPHPARQEGRAYRGRLYPFAPHYSDSSVDVFVPQGFRSEGAVDLVFFFHGWYSTIDETERAFRLPAQLADSEMNALLVVPETARHAPDSFGGKLEQRGGFRRFVEELLERLAVLGVVDRPRPGTVVLAGHSGGYRVIAQILLRGGLAEHIREVYLFDGLYDFADSYAGWIEGSGHRFVAVSAEGSLTAANVERLIATLRSAGLRPGVGADEPSLDPRTLAARASFLQSRRDHYGVVAGAWELCRLLRTSPFLEPVAGPPRPGAPEDPRLLYTPEAQPVH